jgi:hypothetical protein
VPGQSQHGIFKIMIDGGSYAALKITKFVKRKLRRKIEKHDDQKKGVSKERVQLFRRPRRPPARLGADRIVCLLPRQRPSLREWPDGG